MSWGIVAGLITASGFIPQIMKGYRTKRLEDLSYLLNTLIGLGMVMWIVYGIVISNIAVIATNILGAVLNLALILNCSYSWKR